MTRRVLAAVLATAPLALLLAAAPRVSAVSFVDKQVQAGGLLIQNYIDRYGQARQFVYPPRAMVKKGGGLPNAKLIWPANPWTGKVMGPGTTRGTYTYALGADGRTYKLTMHLSKGNHVLRGGAPQWFRAERDTASRHTALLLQRYLESYRLQRGSYPESLDATGFPDPPYVWPTNPWTGGGVAEGSGLGGLSYKRVGDADYTLRVRLTTGWSTPALKALL